jgi:glutamate--cysteine ligase catalytic subunit
MDELNRKESEHTQIVEGCNWLPEYGAWMVEATPNRPYTGFTTDLLRVERNMRLRRKRILTVLKDNEIAPTVSAFPLIGAQGDDGSFPPVPVGGPRTMSDYIGDGIINPHPRFGTLTANIRQRRGSKVNIRVPLFRDIDTPEFKDFDAVPHGDVDGCCGSDSRQVGFGSSTTADVDVDRLTYLFHGLNFSSSGVMEKAMPLKKSMARAL